ncbi:hypothetical protein [Halostagnicola bangensis]
MSERSVLLGILGLQLTVMAIGFAIFVEWDVPEGVALPFFGGLVVTFIGLALSWVNTIASNQ